MAARNTMQMPNIQYPSGYEDEQRKIAMKRKLAQMMYEKGLNPGQMTHPLQALASVFQTWVGKGMDKKANHLEADMNEHIKADLADKLARLQTMRSSGASNEQIMDAFQGDPLMGDIVKPYGDAFASGLKGKEELFDSGGGQGFQRKGDFVGKPLPFDPNKPVMIGPDGQPTVNPVRATAAMAAQGLVSPVPGDQPGMITPVYSMQTGGAQPPAGGSMPAAGQSPSGAGMDFSKFSPEEMGVLKQEIGRRAGLDPQAQNFPQGNPLSPPPSKVGPDGKPYWSVNGKWYDNPEGR